MSLVCNKHFYTFVRLAHQELGFNLNLKCCHILIDTHTHQN